MINRIFCLAALALPAACDAGDGGRHRPPPPMREVRAERPFADWLAPDPDCHGRMQRGEWLVCDNPNLGYLHRILAAQWAGEREGAGRERLHVQRQQLQALLSERAACDTAECVAAAYRRYIAAPAEPPPAPQPRSTPWPRSRPIAHHKHGPRWNWRDNAPACASEIGWARAAYLARQCSVVNPGGECRPERSCGVLRTMVREGCFATERKPGFCRRT